MIDLYTKGWLPYTLRWQFKVTESDPPNGFKLVAEGDFVGTGVWTFRQDGNFVDITYDWRIAVNKRLLQIGTPVFRPIFAANHRWAMARARKAWCSSCSAAGPRATPSARQSRRRPDRPSSAADRRGMLSP